MNIYASWILDSFCFNTYFDTYDNAHFHLVLLDYYYQFSTIRRLPWDLDYHKWVILENLEIPYTNTCN